MAEKKQSAADKKAAGDKKSALETALAQIEKQFGKGAVMKLGQNVTMQVDAISTGSISLDMALGIGGLPRGRIVEIYGPEASGKTTLALHCIAEAQKGGGEVAFIDVEHALDPVYAKALGVDIDSLLVSQPDTGEQALEICEALVRSGAIDCRGRGLCGGHGAQVPRSRAKWATAHVGLQARLMSQAMRKLTGIIGKTNTVVIFINQLRVKVGVVYGNPEVTAGGNALKYLFLCAYRRAPYRAALRIPPVLSSAAARGRRWSRTRWLRLSARRISISCSARASPNRANCWIWPCSWALSRRAARGSAMAKRAWARAATTPKFIWRNTPSCSRRLKSRCAKTRIN